MADNTDLNQATSAGDKVVTREISHAGDTAKLQGVFAMGISGTEGSYTAAAIGGDATNGLDVDVTRISVQGNVDTAAGATQIGVASLAVRDDALATLTEADADLTLHRTNARGALWVALDSTAAQTVTLAAGTATNEVVGDAAHDAAAAGNPLLVGGYASAAAPSDVSADGDVVRAWHLRNGAQATVITAAGALVGGDATNGLDVDVTRVGGNVTVVGAAAEDAAASGNPVLVGGRYDSSARTLETGDVGAIALNASGQVLVEIAAGAGSGGTSAADDADFTAGTTNGTPVMGSYQSSPTAVTDGDMGIIGITANREVKVSVTSGGVSGIVDDAAFTPGTTEGVVFMAHADETSPDSVDGGDAGALRMTLARALHINVRDDAGDSCMDGTNNALRVNLVAGGGSGGTAMTDDAAFTPGTTSVTPIGAMFDDVTPDSVNEGDGGVVRMSANRNLYVTLRDGAGNERGLNIDASGQAAVTVASLPASTNTIEVVGDVAQDAAVAGNPVLVGLRASTAIPTAMSADGDSVYGWADLNGAVVVAGRIVDDAAFTPGTSRVHPIAFQADETATDSVDEGDAGCPRMTLDRKVIVTPYAHAAAGGHTPYKNLDVDESEDEVKGSGGKIFWLHAINLAATKRYLKIYNNTAAGTTVGTTVPDLTFPIPTMGDTNGAGFAIHFGEHGIALGTGITIAATTGFADNDTGAPGANEVIVNLGYL